MPNSNEEILRVILEQSLAGYWDWDIPTGNEYLSPSFKQMFGYEDHEIENRADSWQKLIFQEDLPGVYEKFNKHEESKGIIPFYNEVRYHHKNGSTVWVICTGKVIEWDESGKAKRMVGCHIDITERKRMEVRHAEREAIHSKMISTIGDVIVIIDKNGINRYKSPNIEKWFGWKPEDVVGLDAFHNVHPDDVDKKKTFISELAHTPNGYGTTEVRYRCKNGIYKWIEITIVNLFHDASINGFLGNYRDITVRKRAEEEIASEKERLAVTLRSIGDGVITTDINGNIVLMNKIAEALTGWTQEEAQGKNLISVFTIINESTREPHENPVQKVLSTGEIIELANHTLLISRDGTERIIADSGAPIKDKDSHTIGVVLVFRDMTEKQRFLEITQNAQKLESLGVLAGGIAHDFNNLMSGIYGYIDMASEETKEVKVTTYLSKAINTIDRARALTQQLLTFAKGGAPIQVIGHLFPFVEETARFALSGSNVLCHFDVPQELWACKFDKNQIGQVIDNLIINAQQAMPVGGTIELTAQNIILARKNYVKLSVMDSGIGIPKDMIAKIFDPFFTTKAKGHGLGLATCYSIISRHGGCIDVESEPGKGCTFNIYLPASTDTATVAIKPTDKTHNGSGTFLVMDDEEVIRDTIGDILETLGYTVVGKENGKDTIDFYASEIKANRAIVGIIFDLTVPGGMGGKAAIEEIRKTNTDIPAFVASGYADDPVMKNPTEYGFMASICKPFRKSELSEMLNKYMKPKQE